MLCKSEHNILNLLTSVLPFFPLYALPQRVPCSVFLYKSNISRIDRPKVIHNFLPNVYIASLSRKSCGIKNWLAWDFFLALFDINLPWSDSRAQQYIVRHSKTVISLVGLLMWLLKKNQSTIMLWRKKYLGALEPLHGRFLFVRSQSILRQADFLKLLLTITW